MTHRRTKIIATIGPASRTVETMSELIEAGADVFRLNFSHGTPAEHAENVAMTREAAVATGKQVGILGDLPGPKLRLAEVEGGGVNLRHGNTVTLTTESMIGTPERIPVSWDGLPGAVRPGGAVFVADGRIRLRVAEAAGREVLCTVEVGGAVASHQGLNLPGTEVSLPAAGAEDLDWVDFAIEHGIDLLAVSFVRNASDLEAVQRRVRAAGADIPLVAKIEKPEASERAEEIVKAAPGVMVARGDLGIELPIEQVPTVQRRLLELAGRHSRASITATQMLASMVTVGPADAGRGLRRRHRDLPGHRRGDALRGDRDRRAPGRGRAGDGPDRAGDRARPPLRGLGRSTGRAPTPPTSRTRSPAPRSDRPTPSGLKALVVPTLSGRTAQLVSAHRPRVPILAVSPRLETVRRLNLLFGVQCAVARQWTGITPLLDDCARLALETGVAEPGDLIGITAGLPQQGLGTNLFEVHRVP